MTLPYKKWMVLSGLTAFILLGIIAAKPPEDHKVVYKNLKVLSKNISSEKLEDIMESFNNGLGVTCIFCHPSKRAGTEYTINYETDSMLNKRVAREMLRMTIKLNNKYFNTKMNGLMDTEGRVTCRTCHKRSPIPMLTLPK